MDFLAYVTPRPPLSVHKKIQPNRSSRLAGYREHIYECLVLFYRYICVIVELLYLKKMYNVYAHKKTEEVKKYASLHYIYSKEFIYYKGLTLVFYPILLCIVEDLFSP